MNQGRPLLTFPPSSPYFFREDSGPPSLSASPSQHTRVIFFPLFYEAPLHVFSTTNCTAPYNNAASTSTFLGLACSNQTALDLKGKCELYRSPPAVEGDMKSGYAEIEM
jgi:hypothetical protein